MTPTGNEDLQRTNDIILALQAQRDKAANAEVLMSVELSQARRRISELERQLANKNADDALVPPKLATADLEKC